jgi:dipeptidyl aminopeptidase/acylaminoacyl peptidase
VDFLLCLVVVISAALLAACAPPARATAITTARVTATTAPPPATRAAPPTAAHTATWAPTPTPLVTATPPANASPTATVRPPLPTIAPEFWAAAGVDPQTLVAVLLQAGDSYQPSPCGDIATMRVDGTQLTQLTSYGYNLRPFMAPNRRYIAYRSVPKARVAARGQEPCPDFSHGAYNIWVIAADGTQAWPLTTGELPHGEPVWSPDGLEAAFSEGADMIRVMTAEGAPVAQWTAGAALAGGPLWSPDGQRVAYLEGPAATLVEVDVATQTQRTVAQGVNAPRYRPGGNGIGYTTGGALVWSDDAGAVRTVVPADTLPPGVALHDFDWLPDGRHLVYALIDTRGQLDPPTSLGIRYSLWLVSADGGAPRKLADDGHDVAVSPDGRVVAALRGSGYFDACGVDWGRLFVRLSPDLDSVDVVDVRDFEQLPPGSRGDSFYPSSFVPLLWAGAHVALDQFLVTCVDDGPTGAYVIDPQQRLMVQIRRLDGSR